MSLNTVSPVSPVAAPSIVLCATPYNIDADWFYFSSADEFTAKADGYTDSYGQPVEEFEIQVIDAPDGLARTLQSVIHQGNIEEVLEFFEELDGNDEQQAALHYLLEVQGLTFEEARDKLEDVILYSGSLLDAAYDHIDANYTFENEMLARYFDYAAFARDCELGGDWYAFTLGGSEWVVLNANE